jgi:hypothetical protein
MDAIQESGVSLSEPENQIELACGHESGHGVE